MLRDGTLYHAGHRIAADKNIGPVHYAVGHPSGLLSNVVLPTPKVTAVGVSAPQGGTSDSLAHLLVTVPFTSRAVATTG